MYHRYYDLYFTTATILQWKYLLLEDAMKDIIIDSLTFLTTEKRAMVYAFVIMPNHLHLIWHIPEEHTLTDVKAALSSYTAHQFKKTLQRQNPQELARYKVDLADRAYQFWERNPLSVAIYYEEVFWQKVRYVHWNPCTGKWQLAASPEGCKYSSAYLGDGNTYWDFLTSTG